LYKGRVVGVLGEFWVVQMFDFYYNSRGFPHPSSSAKADESTLSRPERVPQPTGLGVAGEGKCGTNVEFLLQQQWF
jgi:hypothetical protein